MGRWYVTLEACKRALWEQAPSGERDKVLSQKIEAASREIEGLTHRIFIPKTQTRNFDFPYRDMRSGWVLPLDEDLISVSALTKDDDTATAIVAADYFLEPANYGPPYSQIQIDLSSSAFFSSVATHQRAVRVTGIWGYCQDTEAAGALAEADDGTETALDVTDSSLIGIGDTLLIGTEQMFVRAKSLLTTGTTLNDTLTASKADTGVTVASGAAIKDGEVITLDSERMFVDSISANDLTVIRAYDGSTLAAHTTGITIYAPRTLTVDRAVNGTTAAAHNTAAAIVRYVAPYDVVNLCEAIAIFEYMQSRGGRTGVVGSGEGAVEITGRTIAALKDGVRKRYLRHAVGAV